MCIENTAGSKTSFNTCTLHPRFSTHQLTALIICCCMHGNNEVHMHRRPGLMHVHTCIPELQLLGAYNWWFDVDPVYIITVLLTKTYSSWLDNYIIASWLLYRQYNIVTCDSCLFWSLAVALKTKVIRHNKASSSTKVRYGTKICNSLVQSNAVHCQFDFFSRVSNDINSVPFSTTIIDNVLKAGFRDRNKFT